MSEASQTNGQTSGQVPAVYTAITAVQSELAKAGISKDRKNTHQGYQFRGIDDVFNALAPLLAKHGLCILPRMKSREMTERTSSNNKVTFYVTVEAEFDFVSKEDGSKHTISTFGEAMDTSDKATNKAMSAAYKYAAFMAFAIPTEGDNDADATTHNVAPRQPQNKTSQQPQSQQPADAVTENPTEKQIKNAGILKSKIEALESVQSCDTAYNYVMQQRSRGAVTELQLRELAELIKRRKVDLTGGNHAAA